MSAPILVTGATGNVGSALVEYLSAAGVSVRVAVRDPGTWTTGERAGTSSRSASISRITRRSSPSGAWSGCS